MSWKDEIATTLLGAIALLAAYREEWTIVAAVIVALGAIAGIKNGKKATTS